MSYEKQKDTDTDTESKAVPDFMTLRHCVTASIVADLLSRCLVVLLTYIHSSSAVKLSHIKSLSSLIPSPAAELMKI